MGLFSFLYKKPIFKNRMDYFYKHPEFLVDIEFANRTDRKKESGLNWPVRSLKLVLRQNLRLLRTIDFLELNLIRMIL